MKATNGNVFVTVSELVPKQTPGGVYKDIRFNRHNKIAISGEVVAVPRYGNSEVLYEEFEGFPQRRTRPATFHRASEFPCTGKVGDKAYFHYLTLELPSNHILTESGEQVYRVPVSDVFCWVRQGEIIMNFNWVLATPYWGEGVQDLGNVKGKTKIVEGIDKPLVTEIVFKPQTQMAIIKHIGQGIYQQRKVEQGDLVFLTPSCEFDNEIEGVLYWTFKHEDIIAVRRGEMVDPVADYTLIQTDRSMHSGKVIVDERYLASAFTGVFVQGGEKVTEYKRGERVVFTSRDSRAMMSNLLLMKQGNIVATLK